jgi:hypothetical protein
MLHVQTTLSDIDVAGHTGHTFIQYSYQDWGTADTLPAAREILSRGHLPGTLHKPHVAFSFEAIEFYLLGLGRSQEARQAFVRRLCDFVKVGTVEIIYDLELICYSHSLASIQRRRATSFYLCR